MSVEPLVWRRPRPTGTVVAVSSVGDADGSLALAAALACVGSAPERAGLLLELGDGSAPRAGLVASAAARELEERLATHRPDLGIASRGSICRLMAPGGAEGIEAIRAALPLARESIAVLHLPAADFEPALAAANPAAAVLRADLGRDRPLAGLAVRALLESGLRVAVAKRALSWVAARRALLGLTASGSGVGLSSSALARLLGGLGR